MKQGPEVSRSSLKNVSVGVEVLLVREDEDDVMATRLVEEVAECFDRGWRAGFGDSWLL